MIVKFAKMLILMSVFGLMLSCGKKSEEEEESSDTLGSGDDKGVKEDSENVGAVSDNMVPGSLAVDTSSELALAGNPCEDTEGFFDCQPVLLKLYLSIVQDMVDSTAQILGKSEEYVSKLSVGAEGEEAVSGSKFLAKIEYKVSSAEEYTLLLHSKKGSFVYLDVDKSEKVKTYDLYFNAANAPDSDQAGVVHATIEFESKTSFTADVSMTGMKCNDDDVRAPNKIRIKVTRDDDVWNGKAMLYHPRFQSSDDDTCDLEISDATEMLMYTDFAGNDDNSSGSLYLLPSNVDDVDNITDYPASSFCSNFSSSCSGGKGFGDPNPVSSYGNPFCATSDDAQWNADCSDVTTDDYSAKSMWITPEAMADFTNTFPSKIK